MSSIRQRLAQYDILGPLGAGGMGEVYVARDPNLGRKVAIKFLPMRLSTDKDSLSRFTQEARSASGLNHPNIVTIYEVGSDNGSPYIVMEYIEGQDLRHLINEGPQPNRKTVDIAAQIADGLAAAHERGIIHRDLKPENVMYTKDGYVKILDFGLAKVMRPAPADDESDDTLMLDVPGTNPGTILGTVGYMSPEQATGKRLDFRSDQFALGAILYELATGKPAFDGENVIDTMSAILHEEPPPIRNFNGKAPAPFCWVVDRLLSKDREGRYTSTRDLARELRSIRDHVATEATALDIPRPPLFRGRGGLIAALAAGAIAVAGGIGLWMHRADLAGAPAATSAGVLTPDGKSQKNYLAVMRFKDLTGDPNGQLVVDGFAETLTARLADFPSLQVMRPTTPEALAATDPDQIARDVGANVVLTGSMQRAGDRIRVAFRVIDTAAKTERRGLVDGPVSDLFALQDRLADSVAQTLHLGNGGGRVPSLDPAVSQREYLEALGHLRRYDSEASVDSAIAILQQLSPGTSASVQAALGRAFLYKFQLTHDAKWAIPAANACEQAVQNDSQNPDVHVTLGELRRQTGRLDDAIKEFNQALAQQPNNADAILGLAETYKAAGRLNDAEAAYRRSIQLQPTFWGGYNKLGAFYATHGRYEESASMFKKVVDLLPDSQRGYNNLGAVYQQMGRYDDAITVFSTSIAKKPTSQAYSNLGTCYYFLGRYDEAATAYNKAIELAPTMYLYWANLGDALRWTTNDKPKAPTAFDRAINLAQNELRVNAADATIRARMAICMAKRGRVDEARREIQTALRTDPTNPSYMYKAAVVSALAGRDADAISWLDRATLAGYNKSEIERDPELARLRQQKLLPAELQPQAQSK